MVKPGREHRGGPTVVLGRPHDDDRVRGPPIVAAGLIPDADGEVAEGDDADDERRQDQAGEGAHDASAA